MIEAVAPASDWLETIGQQYEREPDEGSWSLALRLHAASHSQTMRELVRVNTARLHDFVRQTALAAQAACAPGTHDRRRRRGDRVPRRADPPARRAHARDRKSMTEPKPPAGDGLAPLLWVIAVLLGCWELLSWIFERRYR